MTMGCESGCNDHGKVCANIDNLEKRLDEFKQDYNRFVGATQSKFEESTREMKELRKELTEKMDAISREIKSYIDNKEKDSSAKKLMIFTCIIASLSPLIAVVTFIIDKVFK